MLLFFLTIFPISLMPGINMTYALNLGIARGYLRALPALLAQVLGVAAVALACVFGVAGILLAHPAALSAIKILGGAYIFYLGVATFLARGNFKLQKTEAQRKYLPARPRSRGFRPQGVDIFHRALSAVFGRGQSFRRAHLRPRRHAVRKRKRLP